MTLSLSVAPVRVDKRRIVKARLALDARLAFGIPLRLVHAEDRRALLEVQADPGLEEYRARSVHSRGEDERAASIGGERVDALLQRPGGEGLGAERRGGEGQCRRLHA